MLAVLLSASCAQDGGTESQQGAARTGISILGTAVGDDSAAAAGKGTRTAYEESDAAVKVTWVAGDAIGVYTEVDGTVQAANYGYRAGTSGATTMFSYLSEKEVVGWADETSEHDFYACYPYAASESAADPHAHPLTLAAEQTWNTADPLAHLAALDFMYGSALGQTQESVGALNPVPIRFRHLFSILEVRIRCNQFAEVEAVKFRCTDESEPVSLGEGSTVDLATGEITPANGTNEIRLTGSQITQLGQYVTCHLVITPGHAGKEFEIVAQVNGNDYVMTTRTAPDGGIQPGKTLVVSADLTVSDEDAYPTIDLSEGGCANTYYVTKPGELYKFRADVKGNGKALSLAGLSYTEADLQIEPKKALILWYDCVQTTYTPWKDACPIVKGSVQLSGDGYVYFSTPKDFINGNVVIIALDTDLGYDEIQVDVKRQLSNANILWSWNLVCTEGYDPNASENQIAADGYTFMSRDLGAVIDLEDIWIDGKRNDVAATSLNGNRYQFGRKDPRPHIPDYMSLQVDYMTGLCYTAAYTPIPALGLSFDMNYDRGHMENQLFIDGSDGTWINIEEELGSGYALSAALDLMAKNPHLWIFKSNSHWIPNTDAAKSVWGTPRDGSAEKKTIYDPCPAGWKVASDAAWEALIADYSRFTISTEFDRGYLFDNKWFFPFNGGVYNSQGKPATAGYIGSCAAAIAASYMTSGPITNFEYARLYELVGDAYYKAGATMTKVEKRHISSTYGGNVRCVKFAED